MKSFAIVRDGDGRVMSILEAADTDTVALNTPSGCKAINCDPTVAPGARWTGAAFLSPIVASLTTAEVEDGLVKSVKSTAARKKMRAMSPGTSKPEEYRLKAPEIAASANVLAAVLNSLTAANALKQYPTAAIEAKCSGEPLATVLERYRSGASGSDPEIRRLSAIEHTAVARIKAAKTIAEKRAAYAAINWNWTA